MNSNKLQSAGLLLLLFVGIFLLVNFLATQADSKTLNLERLAAENSLWYSSWNSAAKPDPNSKNASLRLLAEPSVQKFLDDLAKRTGLLMPAMAETFEPDETDEQRITLLRKIGIEIATATLEKEGCLFVEDFELDSRSRPKNIKALLALSIGPKAEALAKDIVTALKNNGSTRKTIESVEFESIAVNPQMNSELLVGAHQGVLLIGFGEATVQQALQRLNSDSTKPPKWLSDIKLHSPNAAGLSYFDVPRFAKRLAVENLVNALFLHEVQTVELTNGFSESAAYSRVLIRTKPDPETKMIPLFPGSIEADLCKSLPEDSLFAGAASIEPAQIRLCLFCLAHHSLRQQKNKYPRPGPNAWERQFLDGLNGKLILELIENLGTDWVVHNGAADGWYAGLTVSGTLKDPKAAQETINNLIKYRLIENEKNDRQEFFSKRKCGDTEIVSFHPIGFGAVLQPSWAIDKGRIVLGLYPEAVQTSVLAVKDNETSLLTQQQMDVIARPFASKSDQSKLVGMAYVDSAKNLEVSYPYFRMATGSMRSLLSQPGKESGPREAVAALMNGIRLPPARDIHKHLSPSLTALRKTDLGFELESHQVIPNFNQALLAPIASASLIPSVQMARGGARRIVSQNKLRQISLAALNYESAFQCFPPGYTLDTEEEKLLSWRVLILPYLGEEERKLADKFKTDEPWDSPNNKPLLERMPAAFRSPSSNAPTGYTTYRGAGGRYGVLGPPRGNRARGTKFSSVSDGSSYTIFALETSDELAVPWTKPDEGLDLATFDRQKIVVADFGGTAFTFTDGSIGFLDDSVDRKSIEHLMNMADGNRLPRELGRLSKPKFGSLDSVKQKQFRARIDSRYLFGDDTEVMILENMLSDSEKQGLFKARLIDDLKAIGRASLTSAKRRNSSHANNVLNDENKPILSWRVLHSLAIQKTPLRESKIDLRQPWDSKTNLPFSKNPDPWWNRGTDEPGKTRYQLVVPIGREKNPQPCYTLTELRRGRTPADGLMMAVYVGADKAVPWTQPVDFIVDPENPFKNLGKLEDGKFLAVMYSGAIREFDTNKLTKEAFLKMCKIENTMAKEKSQR